MIRLVALQNQLTYNSLAATQDESSKSKASGALTQEIIDLLDQKLKTLKQVATLSPMNRWKLDSEKKGLKIHTRDDPDTGCKWVRGETIVNTTPMDLIERALYAEGALEGYDSTSAESKSIERINGYSFSYSLGKKPSRFVAARDTLVCNRWLEENGVIYCIGTSVKHPKCPEREGVVRANVIIWGYILTPLKEDPNKTQMIYILATDAKGNIPKTVVNWFVKEQAEGVAKIRDWIDLNPKKQQ